MGAQDGLRIACVYRREEPTQLEMVNMARIRFRRMAEALPRRGHHVDIITNISQGPRLRAPRLREVPFRFARWDSYDVIKTSFHKGFDSLMAEGGGDHPFIISKLGSVVGHEQTPGVHFFGRARQLLFETQKEIARRSRVVTILTEPSAELWRREHGGAIPILMAPTGVDEQIPEPGPNPYPALGIRCPVALFAGNLYKKIDQEEVNLIWQDRLNRIGFALERRGIRLVAMGSGATEMLDPRAVIHLGEIDADDVWDFQRYACAGIVLAQAPIQDNESSKIYYYLRTGLPVVCERGVPNTGLIEETGCGAVVDYDDVEALADAVSRVKDAPRDERVAEMMAREHSWDKRAALYDPILAEVARRYRSAK
ncbi:MAG TPA: glycosyltransferase [Candidatus Binataceae bacterium]|nr:glycosyltransferase [Candidatus Binataceae bacterium]